MNTPSVKITINGYEGLSITAEIPYNDGHAFIAHDYFMEAFSFLLEAAQLSANEEKITEE
jgi:hypothetical protein